MRYFFALVFPPMALILCGKPFQAILNLFFLGCFYFPGALHALLVVGSMNAERRHKEHMALVRQQNKEMARQTKQLAKGAKAQQMAARAMRDAVAGARPSLTVTPTPQLPGSSGSDPIVDVDDTEENVFVPSPKKPLGEMFKDWVASLGHLKANAIDAYQGLPEWAHPITWGLAAGSAMSMIIVVVMAFRR